MTFHKLPETLYLATNQVVEHSVAGKTICLASASGVVYAFSQNCPHSGAPFCTGWVDSRGHLVCPLHKYRFDMRNGYNVTGEGYRLKRFPLEHRDDGLYIGLED